MRELTPTLGKAEQKSSGLAWASAITSGLAVAATVGNVLFTYNVSRGKLELEMRQIALSDKLDSARLQLDRLQVGSEAEARASESRLNRVTFVYSLTSDLLEGGSSERRRAATNTIRLILTEDEFADWRKGILETASAEAQEAIEEVVANVQLADERSIDELISQLDSQAKNIRIRAAETLISEHSHSRYAVEKSISYLEPPILDSLTPNGRINLLVVLAGTEPQAWSADLVERGYEMIARLEERDKEGAAQIGKTTRLRIDEFVDFLRTLEIAVAQGAE
jgi:hypothetical protein